MHGRYRLLIQTVAVELVMLLSLGNSTGLAQSSPGSAITGQAAQAPAQLATAQAAAPSPGTLLYAADGTRGFAGWKTYKGEPLPAKDWRIAGGQLLSTGVESAYAKAPYEPGKYKIANYAVEAQIRVLSLNKALNPPHGFGLVVRGVPADYLYGYQASLVADQTPLPEIWFLAGVSTGQVASKQFVQFNPSVWHTLRMEVSGAQIRFLIDGALVVQGTDEHPITEGGWAGVQPSGPLIAIRSFTISGL